jgi:hypothetical protein
MVDNNMSLLNEVSVCYSEKLVMHDEPPGCVDWNGGESQVLRFEHLCKVIKNKEKKINQWPRR